VTDTPNPTIREYIQVGLQARANRARTGIVITVKESPEGFTIETWTRMEHKLQTTQYPNLDELFDRIMYAETAGG
jgi:hypothetical protein